MKQGRIRTGFDWGKGGLRVPPREKRVAPTYPVDPAAHARLRQLLQEKEAGGRAPARRRTRKQRRKL